MESEATAMVEEGRITERGAGSPLRIVIHLILVIGIMAAISISLPDDSFWITDNGNRWIHAQSLVRTGGEIWIDWSGRELDPTLHFFPRGGHHFFVDEGRIGSFYGPMFPALAAMVSVAAGEATRVILPLAGTTLILLMSVLLARRLGVDPIVTVWLVGFATPVAFYSMTFWEHTLATGLALLALWLSTRDDLLASLVGGAIMAVSVTFREEGYLFALGIVLAIGLRRQWTRLSSYVVGLISVLAIHWQMLRSTYGSVLGPHVASYLDLDEGRAPLLDKLVDYAVYLFQLHPDPVWNLVLVLPHVGAILLSPFVIRGRCRGGWLGAAILVVSLSTFWLAINVILDPHPDLGTLDWQGFFTGLPLAIVALVGAFSLLRSKRIEGLSLAVVFLVVVLVTPIFLHTADIGIIWGPRHFFHVFPLAILLALSGFEWLRSTVPSGSARQFVRVSSVAIILASLLLQAGGLRAQVFKRTASADIVDTVRSLDDVVIVTDVYWLPEELGAIFYDKILFETRSSGDFLVLAELLRNAGVPSFAFVTSPQYGVVRKDVLLSLTTEIRTRKVPVLGTIELVTLQCDPGRTSGGSLSHGPEAFPSMRPGSR